MATETPNSAVAANSKNEGDNSDIPELVFSALTKDSDKQDALKLVTDSIAQQRQAAAFAVIIHPVTFAGLVISCTTLWRQSNTDFGKTLLMVCGLVIAYLAAVRMFTSRYIQIAESLKWKEWITGPDGTEDMVLAVHYGGELIGSLVLRLVAPESKTKKAKSGPSSLKGGQGLIRAWTIKLMYRNNRVGGDLLRLAVLTTRHRCGEEATVSFADDHANNARVLPNMFNRPFNKRDERAAKALENAVGACDRGDSSFQAAQ